jgi:hypothetical protein
MWVVIHWYFLYICRPHVYFHLAVGTVLLIYDKSFTLSKIENIQSAVGMVFMYVGFYMRENILDYVFLPWWTLCLVGVGHHDGAIFAGGLVLLLYFLNLSWMEVAGHILMNIGRMIRTKQLNARMHGIAHTIICILASIIVQRDVVIAQIPFAETLAFASSIVLISAVDKIDWFSLMCMYSSMWALPLGLIHAVSGTWYEEYRDNKFRIVKGKKLVLVPIIMICYRISVDNIMGISLKSIAL